jgi:Brp/Blh family beta-carotene 15,15'-monooxygenase
MTRWAVALAMVVVARVLPASWLELAVLAAVGTIGLAHGALDPVLARGRAGPRFFLGYLLAVFAVLAVWYVAPGLSLVTFLVASAYHFGDGDVRHLSAPSRAACMARGALVVLVPLVLHPPEVLPIIESLGVELPRWSQSQGVALAMALGAWSSWEAWRAGGAEAVADGLVLFACFVLLPVLVSFALYFTVWHAAGHIVDVRRSGARGLLLPAVLGTVASWVGLGVLVAVDARWGTPEARWSSMFALLSAVTAPHLIVVARWRLPWSTGSGAPLREQTASPTTS